MADDKNGARQDNKVTTMLLQGEPSNVVENSDVGLVGRNSGDTHDTNLMENIEQGLDHDCEYVENEKESISLDNEIEGYTPSVPIHCTPSIGMEFKSDKDAFQFYRLYANMSGFDVRTNSSKKKRGIVVWRQFTCNKEGMKRKTIDGKKERVAIRCGCPAKVNLSWKKEQKVWIVSSMYLPHNHELHSPSKFKMLKGAHQFDEKHDLLMNECVSSNLKPYQVMNVLSHEADDLHDSPFTEDLLDVHFKKMVRTYFGKDCQYLVDHFKEKKEDNPDFYYAIQFDSMGQFSNCFWVDAKGREDYYYFGDVVLFDTSYKTNDYLMPFVPFIGVNHHCQSIVFGCALLIDETEASFMWVFSEWLQAMGGKYPITIITDQDLGMCSVIEKVFPHSIHKYYIWHIHQKVTDYVNQLYKNPEFRDLWEKWICQSEKVEEFETLWGELVTSFPTLKENDWVMKLWNTRAKWAKPYISSTFMAGISTTQRNESMNELFRNYVNKKTSLGEFIVKFDEAIQKRRRKELKYDHKMKNEVEPLVTNGSMELQLRSTFTPTVFHMFREQLLQSLGCRVTFTCSGDSKIYKVIDKQLPERINREYEFTFNGNLKEMSTCTCSLWKSSGIPCCHIFSILTHESFEEIPSTYVLKRWTRTARSGAVHHMGCSNQLIGVDDSLMIKRHILSLKANKCISAALSSRQQYERAIQKFDKILAELESIAPEVSGAQPCPNKQSTSGLENMSTNAEEGRVLQSTDNMSTNTEEGRVLQSTDLSSSNNVTPINCKQAYEKGIEKQNESVIHNIKPLRMFATCHGSGHDSQTCTSNIKVGCTSVNTVVGKPRICHSCRQTGHDKRNCPRLKNRSMP